MREVLTKSKFGFTVVETLVAIGIIGALMGSVATYVKMTGDTKRKIDLGLALSDMKDNLVQNINSPGAWNTTINNNASLSCLRYGSSGCSGSESGAIAIYNSAGGLIVGTSPTSGFTREGTLCNSFNATSGDANCIFHYSVSWAALCSYSPCYDPQVRITATVTYSPIDQSQRGGLATEKFSFTFYRAETIPNSLEAVCNSLGGTYNSGFNSCQLPWANFMCPEGTVVTGFSPANVPICHYPNAMDCSSVAGVGILRAINPAGAPRCVVRTCTTWSNPTGWIDAAPDTNSYGAWLATGSGGDGGDGGGGDGSCDGAGGDGGADGCDGAGS